MKKITTTLTAIVCAMFFGTMSASSYKSIIINKTDNTNIMVLIESTMTASVAEGNLVITCSKGDVILPVSEVRNWVFSTDDDSENLWTTLEQPQNDATVVQMRDGIVLSNLPQNSQITLFTANGKQLRSVSASGSYELSLNDLPQGIYLLNYNRQTLKIVIAQ